MNRRINERAKRGGSNHQTRYISRLTVDQKQPNINNTASKSRKSDDHTCLEPLTDNTAKSQLGVTIELNAPTAYKKHHRLWTQEENYVYPQPECIYIMDIQRTPFFPPAFHANKWRIITVWKGWLLCVYIRTSLQLPLFPRYHQILWHAPTWWRHNENAII